MDKVKIKKWIQNIRDFDGDKLSWGSIKTLSDIEKEIEKGE